jgi:hypothetical protein
MFPCVSTGRFAESGDKTRLGGLCAREHLFYTAAFCVEVWDHTERTQESDEWTQMSYFVRSVVIGEVVVQSRSYCVHPSLQCLMLASLNDEVGKQY